MPAVHLTDEQIMELVKQLGPELRQRVYEYLSLHQQPSWDESASYFEDGARQAAAERGRNWDAMSDEERIDFVVDVVHEDHRCQS
jgi:hypothetical protein